MLHSKDLFSPYTFVSYQEGVTVLSNRGDCQIPPASISKSFANSFTLEQHWSFVLDILDDFTLVLILNFLDFLLLMNE